jgi:hypothetical protein
MKTKPRRVAVIDREQTRHYVDLVDVAPWTTGFITALACMGDTEAGEIDLSKIRAMPGERIEQTCYRILSSCHDHGVIEYVGITTLENQ